MPIHHAPPPRASLRRSTFKLYREHYIPVFLSTRLWGLWAQELSFSFLCIVSPWTKGGLCVQCPNLLQYIPPLSPLADSRPGSDSLGLCKTLRQEECGLGRLPSFYSAVVSPFIEVSLNGSLLPHSRIPSLPIKVCSENKYIALNHK